MLVWTYAHYDRALMQSCDSSGIICQKAWISEYTALKAAETMINECFDGIAPEEEWVEHHGGKPKISWTIDNEHPRVCNRIGWFYSNDLFLVEVYPLRIMGIGE